MQIIVLLREVEILPSLALHRNEGRTGFAIGRFVVILERGDEAGLMAAPETGLIHLERNLLRAARCGRGMKVANVQDLHLKACPAMAGSADARRSNCSPCSAV